MAHKEQIDFCKGIKFKNPLHFKNKKVLDVGSQDINGSNRYLFTDCEYTGLDIAEGNNVDVVSFVHEYKPDCKYDTIISTEVFEHDYYFEKSFLNIIDLLNSGGIFLFTAAGPKRAEHGTLRTTPSDSPFTCLIEGQENYYRNITKTWVNSIIKLDDVFSKHHMQYGRQDKDIYFYGIKK